MRRLVGSALFNAGWYAWSVLLAVLGAPLLLLSPRLVHAYARFWIGGVLVWLRWTCGLSHRVRGLERLPAGPVILASRHQSSWETLAFEIVFPGSAIVMKRELFQIPVVGWMMWRVGHIGVDRRAGASALRRMLADARGAAAAGRSILIFPEGTRTPVGPAAPYHPGIAAIYSQLGLPVVPIALNSGVFWPRRSFVKRGGTIDVEVLEPIPPGMSRGAFIAELRRRIDEASARLAADARPIDD